MDEYDERESFWDWMVNFDPMSPLGPIGRDGKPADPEKYGVISMPNFMPHPGSVSKRQVDEFIAGLEGQF